MFPSSILTTICLLGGLFCFVPLIAGPLNDFSASKLPAGLRSQRSRDLAVASVTFATPIFFGILIDTITFFFMRVKSKKIRPHVGQELLNTQERLALTSAILVVAIPSLLQIDIPNLTNVWMCLRNCRLTLMGGIINISLCRYDENFWTVPKTCLSLILLASASVIGACAINLRSLDGSPAATVVASLILLLGVGNFLSCSIRWLLSVFPRIYRRVVLVWYTKTDAVLENSRTSECCKHLLFPLLYVTSISVASVVLIPSIAIHPSLHSIEDYLFLDSVGIIAFLLFIMYLSDRMTKVDVIEGLVSISILTQYHDWPECIATHKTYYDWPISSSSS